ncbi:MAG: hypothetical protein Q9201_007095 [Fulgogasparrea decipioides]
MADELAKYDIPLVINQCEYHILRRLPETEGMLHCLPDLLVAGSRPVNWNLYAGARAAKDVPLQQLSDEGPRTDVECIEGDYKGEVDERERCCAQLQYVQGYGVNDRGPAEIILLSYLQPPTHEATKSDSELRPEPLGYPSGSTS